jgi:hypothetical protein
MYYILAVILLILSSPVWSLGEVTEIKGPRVLIADIYDIEHFKDEKRVLIFSKLEDRIVAIGKIDYVDFSRMPAPVKIIIQEIVGNSMVMVEDIIYPLNFDFIKQKNVPGFFHLTLAGNGTTPARYKELAVFGVFTAEGHTLGRDEFLFSPFQIQYGVRDNFSLKMINALWLDGYANIGVKYRALKTEAGSLTLNTLGAYKVQQQDWIWQIGGLLSMPKNSKYQSHLSFNFTLDPQFQNVKATRDLGLFDNSDIRSITEYITNDWNRVLFGPVYNVELQSFGGTLSYMWIWKSFHMSLGIATNDFSELTFGPDAYYYVYDFFWRF